MTTTTSFIKRIGALFGILAASLILAACGTNSSYEQGLRANVTQYRLYNASQISQMMTIQTCYQFSKNTTECSLILAGAVPTQTLGGKPEPLRVAKSPGEILESVVTKGLEATVAIYGIDAVRGAFEAQAAAQATLGAQQTGIIGDMTRQQGELLNSTTGTLGEIANKVPVTIP